MNIYIYIYVNVCICIYIYMYIYLCLKIYVYRSGNDGKYTVIGFGRNLDCSFEEVSVEERQVSAINVYIYMYTYINI
jgi:hypothetical protein